MSGTQELINYINDPSVSVHVRKPPNYVSCVLDNEGEIIFISSTVTKKIPLTVPVSALSESLISLEDLSITGQPLPAPYEHDDSLDLSDSYSETKAPIEKEKHYPVSIEKARKYLSYCTLSLSLEHPVWILTDSKNNTEPVLLSVEKKDDWVGRSWVVNRGPQELPQLTDLLKTHLKVSNLPQKFVDYRITATYKIKDKFVGEQVNKFYSSTNLVLSWNKLCIDPPIESSTETKLITKCKIGSSPCASLQNIWRQILLLHEYVQLISTSKTNNVHTANHILPSSASVLDGFGVKQKSQNIVSKVGPSLREPMRNTSTLPLKNPSLNSVLTQFDAPLKAGMDLTDRLWLLLIECSTYQELVSCFKQLFIEVQQSSSVPFISPNNISSLAKALTGGGGANILDPLEFLVEIGIEKLKKEMLLIFSKAQVATPSILSLPSVPKFTDVPTAQWESVVCTWLTWLGQLECCLELLFEMQESLSLSNELLLMVSSKIIKEFRNPSSKIKSIQYLIDNSLQEINISIPTVSMGQTLPASFENWVLRLSSSSCFRKVLTVVYCSSESPLPHIFTPEETFCGNTTALSMVESSYSMIEMHSIMEKLRPLVKACSKKSGAPADK